MAHRCAHKSAASTGPGKASFSTSEWADRELAQGGLDYGTRRGRDQETVKQKVLGVLCITVWRASEGG